MPSVNEIFSALAFDSSTRLHRLEGQGELSELMVEAWACQESLSAPWQLEIGTLSTRSGLDLHAMLGQKVTLQTVLADGSLHPRSGIVTRALPEDADGGFGRYTPTVRPCRMLAEEGIAWPTEEDESTAITKSRTTPTRQ